MNKQPTKKQILQAKLLLLRAQIALIEMRLAGKKEQYF
jgi:hypothetical protein